MCYDLAISKDDSRLEMKAILFRTEILAPLPFTPKPLVPADKSNYCNAQVRVRVRWHQRFELSLSAFSTTVLPSGLEVPLVYITLLYTPSTLLNYPCHHSHISISEGFCTVCVALCPTAAISSISGWCDINFLLPSHQCTGSQACLKSEKGIWVRYLLKCPFSV